MSRDTCTVPGSRKENRIAPGKAELGLGIRGEAGIAQVDFTGTRDAIAKVVARLAPKPAEAPQVAPLNNLAATTAPEMGVPAEELLRSSIGRRIRAMMGPAPLMPSLDMQGIPGLLMAVTPADEAALMRRWVPMPDPAATRRARCWLAPSPTA